MRQKILNAWWLIGFDGINRQEYRHIGNGVDINVTVLTWKSNSRGMLCCVKSVMAHKQDLLFDKLGVRTDGGHISDVKHFPACKYSLDKKWQIKFTILKMEKHSQSHSKSFDPTKMINHSGKSWIQGTELYADKGPPQHQSDGRR